MVGLKAFPDQNIHISAFELEQLGVPADKGVAFPDGSGYMAQLHVYHDLHCLVRFFLSIDLSFPPLTNLEDQG